MSWRGQFHHLRYPRRKPRVKEPPNYFLSSQWHKFPKHLLVVAISKLGTEEHLSKGPSRVRFRKKRLRAVAAFRERFGDNPMVRDYSQRLLPWEQR